MKFYEDELYIEMCKKLEPLQQVRLAEDYWENGDWYLFINLHEESTIGVALDDIRAETDVWLPRPDQLWEMFDNDAVDSHGAFSSLVYSYKDRYKGAHEYHVLWLMFVAKNEWNLTWDFEKREWQEDK